MENTKKIKTERIVGLGLIGFYVMMTYAFARPSTESLFLAEHGSKSLPYVWILLAVGISLTVLIYNRYVARFDLVTFFSRVTLVCALVLLILVIAAILNLPFVYYLLYVWKDIYVILLVEIYYTFSNSVFPIKTARWAYGFFGMMGAFGGLVGNLVVGVIAKKYGTFSSLWLVIFQLFLLSFVVARFDKRVGIGKPIEDFFRTEKLAKTFRIIAKSRYLMFILLVIPLTQIVMTLIDYQYNTVLQGMYPDMDQRTAIIGKIYASIDLGTVLLHAITGPILRIAGVPITLILLPLLLGSGVGMLIAIPRFVVVAAVKVFSKVFDYTLCRSAKEILYIPLSYAEKTVGKSVADIFTFRLAKALTSFLILALSAAKISGMISWVTLLCTALWLVIISIIVVRFRGKVSWRDELKSSQIGMNEM